MRTRIAVLAVSAMALTGLFAAPAAQAGITVCYDVQATVNGQTVGGAECHTVG